MDLSEIKANLQNRKPIQIVFYENDEQINHQIKSAIDEAIRYYHQSPDMADIAYGCMKELLINATRANLKRAFFTKNNLNLHDMGHYVKGMTMLRGAIDHREYSDYHDEIKNQNLWVMFEMKHNPDGLCLSVINNSAIMEIEEKRIRMKLNLAMMYQDLAEFYSNEKDESEGAGMGIAMIVTLLRHINLDPHLFRIWTKDETTIARLEIPFNEAYVPERQK